ncbi:hypothetical protein AB1L88_14130 [Tautonia sp. JC769]|uniref:hypothetical protein n=1 Tax=Tautonia sp. JC769 TaxID=3232135 RepID=UPI0034596B50
MKPRLSMRQALVLVALAGGILAVLRWFDPVVRYRRDRDADSLYSALSSGVKNGDPVEKLERLLGTGAINSSPELRRSVTAFAERSPTDYPQGIAEDDEFREYRCGADEALILQYRQGRLVNFDPKMFSEGPVPLASSSR